MAVMGLKCTQLSMHAIAHVKESALKADSCRKILCGTRGKSVASTAVIGPGRPLPILSISRRLPESARLLVRQFKTISTF